MGIGDRFPALVERVQSTEYFALAPVPRAHCGTHAPNAIGGGPCHSPPAVHCVTHAMSSPAPPATGSDTQRTAAGPPFRTHAHQPPTVSRASSRGTSPRPPPTEPEPEIERHTLTTNPGDVRWATLPTAAAATLSCRPCS